jgi:hypothetical protein
MRWPCCCTAFRDRAGAACGVSIGRVAMRGGWSSGGGRGYWVELLACCFRVLDSIACLYTGRSVEVEV